MTDLHKNKTLHVGERGIWAKAKPYTRTHMRWWSDCICIPESSLPITGIRWSRTQMMSDLSFRYCRPTINLIMILSGVVDGRISSRRRISMRICRRESVRLLAYLLYVREDISTTVAIATVKQRPSRVRSQLPWRGRGGEKTRPLVVGSINERRDARKRTKTPVEFAADERVHFFAPTTADRL